MARTPNKQAPAGLVLIEGETLTENDISATAHNFVMTAQAAAEIAGADDIVRLALQRARRLLRLGANEPIDPKASGGTVVPMARKGGDGAA